VCVQETERQLVAYVLFVDSASISAVKMSLQDGKMTVKRRGKSEITDDERKFLKLESEVIITVPLAKVQESHGSNLR